MRIYINTYECVYINKHEHIHINKHCIYICIFIQINMFIYIIKYGKIVPKLNNCKKKKQFQIK